MKLDQNSICCHLDMKTYYYYIHDFNGEPTSTTVPDFSEICNLKNIIKDKTCSKNPSALTYVELMKQINQGLPNFLWLSKQGYTAMKTNYNRSGLLSNTVNSKIFPIMLFLKDLKSLLSKFDNEQNFPISFLKETVNKTLEKHVPFKKRYMGTNQDNF